MPRAGDTSNTFGFEEVDARERQGRVNQVFATVAERYDLMNDLMSGGLHRLWKADFVTLLNPPRDATPFRHLDVAGGTGDVAMKVIARGGTGCHATICDISAEMLDVGRERVAKVGLDDRIACIEGNAEQLPFADRAFDGYTIAFGIRNVTHIDQALREAYRVLRPGGRFLCLEFSQVDIPGLRELYDFHSFQVIPRLGQLAAGERQPYDYLVESIRQFPDQETFSEMIQAAGFAQVSYRNLTGGVAAIHMGWRI